MSLINQMLNDLDQRQAPLLAPNNEVADEPYIPISTATISHPSKFSFAFLKLTFYSVVLILLSITSYFSYHSYINKDKHNLDTSRATKTNPAISKSTDLKDAMPIKKKVILSKPKDTVATKKAVTKKLVIQTSAPTIAEKSINEISLADNESSNLVVKQKVRLTPEQKSEIAYKKGYLLLQENKTYSAEITLLQALEHNAKHIKARELIVGLYLKTGRKIEAEAILQEGRIHLPKHANFSKLYARLLLENNQPSKAVKVLIQNKPAMKTDLNYHALLAASYQRTNNHAAAATTYVKLLKFEPREGIWWVGMAISLEALNKHKEALDAYEKARQTGTLNTRISNYSTERLEQLSAQSLP